MTTSRLRTLFEQGHLVSFRRGEQVLRAYDQPTQAYMVESGYVQMYSIADDGRQDIHLIYRPDDIFPIIMILGGNFQTAYFEAMGTTSLWRIPQAQLRLAAVHDKAIQQELLIQTRRLLEETFGRIKNLGLGNAQQRVIYRLVATAKAVGVPSGKGFIVDTPMTHATIAGAANVSRETASRIIQKLINQELIKYQGKRLMIPDIEKLAADLPY